MKAILAILTASFCLHAWSAEPAATPARPSLSSEPVMNFAFLDGQGRFHELRRTEAGAVVLFFTATGCPIARQSYAKLRALRKDLADQGVVVWVINTDDSESLADTESEVRTHGGGNSLPVFVDEAQGVTRMLGITRTCEAVAISTKDWRVFYRGAIDDQLTEGARKPQPSKKLLRTALDQFLAGAPVTEPSSVVHGCLVRKDAPSVSYAREVAPILERKCVECHSRGNIGQWAMSSHARVHAKSAMMQETILARRMPPWDAHPKFGKFSNDRSLSLAEERTLLRWIEAGAPLGDEPDPLVKIKPPAQQWPLGQPDLVVALPSPQQVPATGTVPYRYVDVPLNLTNTAWLGATAIKPGNLECTHHVIVRVKYPREGRTSTQDAEFLEGWSPGKSFERYPDRTGKRLKPGAVLSFELHYTATGKEETDATELGVYFLKEKPPLYYETRMAINMDLNIPPGERDVRVHALTGFKRDTMLYSFVPHMHTRGAWMKYEALYPDGRRETLLHVPRYDFNWQVEYVLAQPKVMPPGSWILCTGGFDNSSLNPHNPDPRQRVHWGEQSWDEMFIGFMNVSEMPRTERAQR